MANLLVYKENKAFNITTERVLKITCYPWVVCLNSWDEWRASVGNVLVLNAPGGMNPWVLY